jgi:hypothetical protein
VDEYIKYQTVGVSADAIWESEEGRIVVQVARNTATRCELRRGSPEPRPWVSACVGLVLAAPGIYLGWSLLGLFGDSSNRFGMRFGAGLVFLAVIGMGLFFRSVLRKRYFIGVTTESGGVRLIFEGDAQVSDIRKFLLEAEAKFGWHIHDALSPTTSAPGHSDAR